MSSAVRPTPSCGTVFMATADRLKQRLRGILDISIGLHNRQLANVAGIASKDFDELVNEAARIIAELDTIRRLERERVERESRIAALDDDTPALRAKRPS